MDELESIKEDKWLSKLTDNRELESSESSGEEFISGSEESEGENMF